MKRETPRTGGGRGVGVMQDLDSRQDHPIIAAPRRKGPLHVAFFARAALALLKQAEG